MTRPFDAEAYLKGLTTRPGVYRMLGTGGSVLYVGKAGNLRKRVASYFGKRADSPKTQALVKQIRAIDVTVTRTEGEALLLESNLIKSLRPRYNVVLRDDKSYPYLYLSSDQQFPRLSFYRGARRGKGRYFGPYPGAGAARRTLNLAQKLFRIRQCDDTFFRNRTRPCLQYQIKRCSAPCVGYIPPENYREDVECAVLFLEGRNEEVIQLLTGPMQRAAEVLDFERAGQYRDQIASLRRIQEQQVITAPAGECDLVGCATAGERACIQVFYVRGGRNLGNRAYYPGTGSAGSVPELAAAFLKQHYLAGRGRHQIPREILVSHEPEDRLLLQRELTRLRGGPVQIRSRVRGDRARWVAMARENAEIALQHRVAADQNYQRRLEALGQVLQLQEPLERIECFDISHTRGEAAVGSCVVFGTDGPLKPEYRRFNIEGIQPGDDYAAMRQVIERRYARVRREEGKLPDLVLIDGGRGQVGVAIGAVTELQLGDLAVVGVAKGPARKPGLETLILSRSDREFRLPSTSPALLLIQEVRDEAHRFAIAGHRARRGRRRSQSPLEQIDGVGARRRQQLLRFFGGMQGVERAGIEELAKVPGINKNLAQRIYNALHGDS